MFFVSSGKVPIREFTGEINHQDRCNPMSKCFFSLPKTEYGSKERKRRADTKRRQKKRRTKDKRRRIVEIQ